MHVDIIGATRSGKTNYILSTLEGAFCFLDKHGDAARQIAGSVECIYWRLADLSYSVSYNPLANIPPDGQWLASSQIASTISDIWKLGFHTPNLLDNLSASLLLLMPTQGTTLLDVQRVLTDDTYRQRLLRNTRDQEVRKFWQQFAEKDKRQQTQEVASTLNKMHTLSRSLPLRFALGQPTSTVDFGKLLHTGMPLVVDLSDIGDEPAAIMGAVIINGYRQAADAIRNTNPYRLVIDECQNFGTHVLDTILSESGKRHLWLTLAHQFVSQLDERLWHSILANCATMISFRVGSNDAPLVAKALDWSAQDLQNQGMGTARYVTLVNGQPSSATLMKTEKTMLADGYLEANVQRTRNRYSRPRSLVERELARNSFVPWQNWAREKPKKKERKKSAWG